MKENDKHKKPKLVASGKMEAKPKPLPESIHKLSSEVEASVSDADGDNPASIGFLVEFSLGEGQLRGKIIHSLTGKYEGFRGLDQSAIISFIRKYLTRLEKAVPRPEVTDSLPPAPQIQTQHRPPESAPSRMMRMRSFEVIPAGGSQHSSVLGQEQPFHIKLSFDPPPEVAEQRNPLRYRVCVTRKNLTSPLRELIGEIKGKVDCDQIFTASLFSEPLPAGTYRLEAGSTFGVASDATEWSSQCQESRLIQVI